jgi:tellurite resistance protein TerC
MRSVRRVVIAIIGATVVAIGLAMVVLPGPAIVVTPAGLAILATEFAWARYLLRRMKEKTKKLAQRARRG